MRRARWKRKNVRDELTDGAANSPKTGAGRHELLTELETPLPAALYLNLKSVRRRICGHGAQRGANRTPPAPLSAAAPPVQLREEFPKGRGLALVPRPLGGWFPKAGGPSVLRPSSPWGLVSKGGGRGPRPLCRFKGVRGEIEIPPRFSLGGPGGHSLFKREYPPWLLPGFPALCGSRRFYLISR